MPECSFKNFRFAVAAVSLFSAAWAAPLEAVPGRVPTPAVLGNELFPSGNFKAGTGGGLSAVVAVEVAAVTPAFSAAAWPLAPVVTKRKEMTQAAMGNEPLFR